MNTLKDQSPIIMRGQTDGNDLVISEESDDNEQSTILDPDMKDTLMRIKGKNKLMNNNFLKAIKTNNFI